MFKMKRSSTYHQASVRDIYRGLKTLFLKLFKGIDESTIHQYLMDKAYDLWHKHPDWDYNDFISHLEPLKRKAVLLGNLNYQVENGGFLQWDGNGYSKYADEVMDVLDEIGTPAAKTVSNLIERFLFLKEEYTWRGKDVYELYSYGDDEDLFKFLYEMGAIDRPVFDFDDYMKYYSEEYEVDDLNEDELETLADQDLKECVDSLIREYHERVNALDREYYMINNQLLKDVANWLLSQI